MRSGVEPYLKQKALVVFLRIVDSARGTMPGGLAPLKVPHASNLHGVGAEAMTTTLPQRQSACHAVEKINQRKNQRTKYVINHSIEALVVVTLCDGEVAGEMGAAGLSCGEDVVAMRTTLLRRRSAQEHALIRCQMPINEE